MSSSKIKIQPAAGIALVLSLVLLSACMEFVDTGLTEERIEGKITPGFPFGWQLYGNNDGQSAYSFYGGIDSEIKQSGEKSVSFLAVAVTKKEQARLTQRFYADAFRGKRVRFSGYLKANRVIERAGLWMRIDTETKQAYAFDDMEDRPVTGTTDWILCRVVLDVPENTVAIYLGAHLIGRGQVWVDNCSFEVVDDDVPATDQYRLLGGYTRTYSVPKFLPDAPVNLDFEEVDTF